MSFEIFTDSASNLTDEMVDKYNINIVSLMFIVEGEEYVSYVKGRNNDGTELFQKLREKKNITTSCVNEDMFATAFEEKLKEGKDIICTTMSSGVSQTHGCAQSAINSLKEKYPERKMLLVDSVSASFGDGMLSIEASEMRAQGATIDEVYDRLMELRGKIGHYFTVDNLYWFQKGGRVSKTSYLIASAGKIKPLLSANMDGVITTVGKAIGRKRALMWVVNQVVTNMIDTKDNIVYIAHGDCIEDAQYVADKIASKIEVKGFEIAVADLVLGIHAGPGFLTAFCKTNDRSIAK